MEKGGVRWKIVLAFLLVIAFAVAIYFTFIFAYSCDDIACFQTHQAECSRAKFVRDGQETVWSYHIRGKSSGMCKVDVEILGIKKGAVSNQKLEGKSMTCMLPVGNLDPPESDITGCSGQLREELQDIIIQKLHAYVVDNLGEIGVELYETLK
tara:strand:+ start:384 stop:842 length:459 start_codon:yes stop_codon:yes gene_type:complete